MKIKIVAINARYTHSCLALFYLRNELEKHASGIDTDLCQYTINDPCYILTQRLIHGNPDYFFFSAAIWNSELTIRLISDLMAIDERYRFVIGGPQARVIGERFSNNDRITVYLGNIEGADRSFYSDLQSDSLKQFYKTEFSTSFLAGVDYPYRKQDFSGPLKNRHIYYESSRGCPFSCTYCLSSAEKGLYHKDLDLVFGELADILSHRPEVVRFIDRTFNDIPERALKIWEFLIENGGDTLFHFEIAPDRFTDEMFDLLEELGPGRFQFEIGIQSTNQKTLEAIKRPMAPETAGTVIKRIRAMENIHIHADLILGLPFETRETFFQSLNHIFLMEPHYIQMGLLKILPDTTMDAEAERYDYRFSAYPPYSVFSNRWIPVDQFRELFWLSECVEKCVNNRYFVTLWKYMRGQGEDIGLFFKTLSERFLEHGYFWKAATQRTLSRLISNHCTERVDFLIIKELLCYDWLRCGHRFLPDHLLDDGPSIEELRRFLFSRLPEELEQCYDKTTRTYFFKKSVFYRFSRETLHHIGYETKSAQGVIRFSPERDENVLQLHRVNLITEDGPVADYTELSGKGN